MRALFIFLAGWLSCCNMVMAQTDSTAKKKRSCSCAFSSVNQVGILSSNTGDYFQFQTINGLRYKTWFAGIGVGLDMYPTSGIPVFVDLRKNIFNAASTPFVYADAGIHFADIHRDKNDWQSIEYNNGFYTDAGIGYKFGLPKTGGILFSLGYSYKSVKKRITNELFDCNLYPCNLATSVYAYQLNRISIKAGWHF